MVVISVFSSFKMIEVSQITAVCDFPTKEGTRRAFTSYSLPHLLSCSSPTSSHLLVPSPNTGSLVEESKCSNQYENKLPHGLYCGGKVSTENPCNQKRGKMRLNWLNWESQKRTTWKISSTTPGERHPLCMLSSASWPLSAASSGDLLLHQHRATWSKANTGNWKARAPVITAGINIIVMMLRYRLGLNYLGRMRGPGSQVPSHSWAGIQIRADIWELPPVQIGREPGNERKGTGREETVLDTGDMNSHSHGNADWVISLRSSGPR